MKKTIWVVLLSMAFALVGCKYDDSELQDKVKDIDGRVTALENKVNDLNTTINGIQNSISALQNQLYVTKLVVNRNADGEPVSYDLTFSDGSVITLVKGLKGDQGNEGPRGEQGEVGPAPVMGVQEIDGLYYWTVEGELLTDAEGNPVPIVGPQGEQGVTPKFKIEQGSWWVSYDNEETWERVGLVSDAETSVIVTEFEDYIELDINGVKVNIPKEKPFTLVFEAREGLGVTKGVPVDFPYTIEGVAEGEETEVDVYSIMGNWTAEAVATDAKSGVIKVTNTDDGTAKVFVYATNHKGKTDMVSLTFEGGVLVATCEVLEVPAAGGAYDLKVEYNVDYEIVVPASADWIEVAPATKATQIKEYVINVAANETNAHRTATVQVINKQTGESAKDIDVLQYPDPTQVTDLASIRNLDDDSKVQANGSIVLAASQEGALVSDGDAYIYITTDSPVAVGDEVSFAGTKKTNEDTDVEYVETTSVTVASSGNEVPDMDWWYIGYGVNFDSMNTGTSGLLQVDDAGAYFVQTPYIDKVQFETPLAALDMASYVGKYITVEGYTNGVNEDEEYNFIVNTVTEINFSVNPDWTLSDEGVYYDTYEMIANTVAAGSTEYFALYGYSMYTKEDAEEAGSIENLAKTEILNVADEIQFYFTRFNEGIEENASIESASWIVQKLAEYGEFVVFAVGLNEKGYPTGKYAVLEIEKENPYLVANYEDFLGDWYYLNSEGVEKWTLTEKVNGESYFVDGFSGMVPFGEVLPEAIYDAETGSFTVSRQDMGTWIYEDPEGDIEETDQLKAVYYSGDYFYNNDKYMLSDLIFTGSMLDDGSVDVIPSNDDYGPLEGFAFYMNGSDGVYSYGVSTKMPGVLTREAPEVDERYSAWLGNWTVQTESDSYSISVATDVPNTSYLITGINNFNYSFVQTPANFDAETGEMVILGGNTTPIASNVSLGLDQYFYMYLLALVDNNGSLTPITGDYELCRGSIGSDGSASFSGGTLSINFGEGAKDYPIIAQRVYCIGMTDSSQVYTLNGEIITSYPFTMVPAASGAPVKASFDAAVKVEAVSAKPTKSLLKRVIAENATRPAANPNASKGLNTEKVGRSRR